MLTLVFAVLLALLIGIAVGAYSHKWLAKVTGAPSNLTVATAPAALAAVADHGVAAAHAAIDDVAAAAKASVAKV
jgi:hypothetical protein